MSNGLAVAATPVGAVELLVDNSVGWIIKTPSVRDILNVLELMMSESKTEIDVKKQNAVNKIKTQFTWNNIFKKLLADVENHG